MDTTFVLCKFPVISRVGEKKYLMINISLPKLAFLPPKPSETDRKHYFSVIKKYKLVLKFGGPISTAVYI